jgi:hypothetical protein
MVGPRYLATLILVSLWRMKKISCSTTTRNIPWLRDAAAASSLIYSLAKVLLLTKIIARMHHSLSHVGCLEIRHIFKSAKKWDLRVYIGMSPDKDIFLWSLKVETIWDKSNLLHNWYLSSRTFSIRTSWSFGSSRSTS